MQSNVATLNGTNGVIAMPYTGWLNAVHGPAKHRTLTERIPFTHITRIPSMQQGRDRPFHGAAS